VVFEQSFVVSSVMALNEILRLLKHVVMFLASRQWEHWSNISLVYVLRPRLGWAHSTELMVWSENIGLLGVA